MPMKFWQYMKVSSSLTIEKDIFIITEEYYLTTKAKHKDFLQSWKSSSVTKR